MSRAIVPSLLTVGNLFCGFLAIHYIIQGSYVPAAWLVILGAVFDNMDGRIARYMGKDSHFGIEFDSLVDVCTFGVAPALMIYSSQLSSGWGLAIAFLYLLCGALRLARYNTLALHHDKGDFFLGMPIPGAAVILTQYVVFTERAWESEHAVTLGALLVLLLSFLMVSRLEYDCVPNFRATGFWDRFKQVYIIAAVIFLVLPSTSQELAFPMTLGYLASGIYRWVIGIFSDEVTQHA